MAYFRLWLAKKFVFGHLLAGIAYQLVLPSVETRLSMSAFARFGIVVSCLIALSACTSAPTYGTGTRSDVQLLEDVAGILTINPAPKDAIDYKPRPGVIAPASSAALPAPQESITKLAGVMPETPEIRRQRLRDEATANQNNPLYKSPIINTGLGQVQTRELTPLEQQERFRAARKIQDGAYEGRRFLSDPPAALKVAADTAPVGDLGEPEKKKEARLRKAAQGGNGFSLRNLWPW